MKRPWITVPDKPKRGRPMTPRENAKRARILKALRARDMTASDLARLTGAPVGDVCVTLRVFERRGLVVRTHIHGRHGLGQGSRHIWSLATATRGRVP